MAQCPPQAGSQTSSERGFGANTPRGLHARYVASTLPVPCALGLLVLAPTECHFCLMDMGDIFHAPRAPLDSWDKARLTLADSGHGQAQRSQGGQNQIPRSATAGHRRARFLSPLSKFFLLAGRTADIRSKGDWKFGPEYIFEQGAELGGTVLSPAWALRAESKPRSKEEREREGREGEGIERGCAPASHLLSLHQAIFQAANTLLSALSLALRTHAQKGDRYISRQGQASIRSGGLQWSKSGEGRWASGEEAQSKRDLSGLQK